MIVVGNYVKDKWRINHYSWDLRIDFDYLIEEMVEDTILALNQWEWNDKMMIEEYYVIEKIIND
jgi:hypothetical protein